MGYASPEVFASHRPYAAWDKVACLGRERAPGQWAGRSIKQRLRLRWTLLERYLRVSTRYQPSAAQVGAHGLGHWQAVGGQMTVEA